MKRVWIFVGIGFLLLLFFGWWYSQREWLTDELIAQIKVEMKKEEVEALLGKPEKGYELPSLKDWDALWLEWKEPKLSKITLVAPEDSWLPTLTTDGPAIGLNGSAPLGPIHGPLREDWVWIGRDRALILSIDEDNNVQLVRVFRMKKSGGGFLAWLSHKWDDWMQGK